MKLKNGQVEDDKLLTKRVLDALEDPNAWVGKKEQDGDGHALTVVRNSPRRTPRQKSESTTFSP